MNKPHLIAPPHACAALACAAALLVTACAGPAALVQLPDKLKPAAHQSLAMVVPAKGVQIYECRATKDNGYEWTFVAPEAELFDRSGKSIGRHDAGPRWSAADGSRIRGTVKERVDAPVAGAIPWLLLAASDEGSQGAFSGILSILRVNTAGGLAPTNGCGRDMTGASTRVAYTADYYFYRSKP